jgi:hypothetical protein
MSKVRYIVKLSSILRQLDSVLKANALTAFGSSLGRSTK